MKTWNEVRKFTTVVRLSHPHIVEIWIGFGLFTAFTPFASLLGSAAILEQLLQKDYEAAFHIVLWMCTAILISSFLAKLFYHQIQIMRKTAMKEVDRKLLEKAMVMEYEMLEQQETLDTLRRTRNSINGSGNIGDAIYNMALCVASICKILCSLIALLILVIQMHIWDGYIFLFLIVLSVFLVVKQGIAKEHGKLLKDLCDGNDRNNAQTNYLLQFFYRVDYAKEHRLYHMESFYDRKAVALLADPVYVDFAHHNGMLMFLDSFLSQGVAFGAYVYVALLAIRSIISISQVLYMSGMILNAVSAITDFQVNWAQLRHQLSYLNAFYDFIKASNMHYEGTLPVEKRDDHEYSFRFEHVSFQYSASDKDILKDISLEFRIGEKLAIVGLNGAGKTTIVKLLCRLYEPTQGRILLNGIDIRKYDYQEYVSLFSVVFQDFSLFSYELDQNIASGETVDEQRVNEILENLNMMERVNGFKDQKQSLLFKDNGDGVSVSGGEAQKLAIARALYKDAPFVILDEPTAALDPISEAEIYEHFDLLVKGKTTLYISHRMSSCKFCDRILVLEAGVVREEGSHTQLLSLNGIYASLWNAQAEYYND